MTRDLPGLSLAACVDTFNETVPHSLDTIASRTTSISLSFLRLTARSGSPILGNFAHRDREELIDGYRFR